MSKTTAAVDFGTSKITTVIFDCADNGKCSMLGFGSAGFGGYSDDGKWLEPEKLDEAIKKSIDMAQDSANTRIDELFVGVPGEFMRVHLREAQIDTTGRDGVEPRDLDMLNDRVLEMLKVSRSTLISQSAAWYRTDDGRQDMEPIGRRSESLSARISVVTADSAFIDDMDMRFGRLNIRVIGYMPAGLGEAVLLINSEDRDRTAAMVDVGYLHTEVMIMQGDAMVDYMLFPVGGAMITSDLAYALDVSFDTAEEIKRAYSFRAKGDIELDSGKKFPRDFVTEVVTARADDIADFVRDALAETKEKLDPDLPIYLTGGGLAMMDGGDEYLSEKIGRDVTVPVSRRLGKLSEPCHSAILGLIDMAFDRLDSGEDYQETITDKIMGLISRIGDLFRRR